MGLGKNKKLVLQLNNALELQRHIVGVKFLYTEEEFVAAEAKKLEGYLPYCVMVRSASLGHSIKATRYEFGCYGGSTALHAFDMDEIYAGKEPDYFTSGRSYFEGLKIYKTIDSARKTAQAITILEKKIYGVMLKPLEEYAEDPDVVIIVTVPYNIMRLIQGYNYEYGTNCNFKMGGNQAVCSETTAYPFESGDINVSVLCSGTRMIAKWGRDELSMGIPYHKFSNIVNGVNQTINMLERDPDKKRIEANMEQTNEKVIDIVYGVNYDTGAYKFGKGDKK
jgi:uncharacterized protein (DUF169 family)